MTYNENWSFKLKHKTKLVSSNLLLMENLGVFCYIYLKYTTEIVCGSDKQKKSTQICGSVSISK